MAACIISTAQQARPKVMNHRLLARAACTTSSSRAHAVLKQSDIGLHHRRPATTPAPPHSAPAGPATILRTCSRSSGAGEPASKANLCTKLEHPAAPPHRRWQLVKKLCATAKSL